MAELSKRNHALLEDDDHNVQRWAEVQGQAPSPDLAAVATYVLLARKYEVTAEDTAAAE